MFKGTLNSCSSAPFRPCENISVFWRISSLGTAILNSKPSSDSILDERRSNCAPARGTGNHALNETCSNVVERKLDGFYWLRVLIGSRWRQRFFCRRWRSRWCRLRRRRGRRADRAQWCDGCCGRGCRAADATALKFGQTFVQRLEGRVEFGLGQAHQGNFQHDDLLGCTLHLAYRAPNGLEYGAHCEPGRAARPRR